MTRIDLPDGVRAHSYGHLNRRAPKEPTMPEPTEAEYQQCVVDYCRIRHIPIFHIPNGGSRNAREAANLKRQGVKPGVPDLCIPLARGGFHGLYIELKRNEKSKTTECQHYWLNRLSEEGYLALVCYGADEAICQIDRYVRQTAMERGTDGIKAYTQQENA